MGECPDEFASGSASGCHTSFEPIGVYLMFVMMGLDFVNFGLFFRRLLYMRSVAPEVQKAMIHHFKLLASVMISCVVDGTVSLAFQNEFDTMFVFLIDCAVLSLLNYLMLSTPFSVCCHRPSIRLCRSCKCKCKICPTDAEAQLADNINHNSAQTALRCVAEECRTEGMKALMKQCTLLSQYADISKWFGYLVGHRIVDVDDGEVLREKMNALCAKMAPMSLSVCEAFGVPEKLMPPIAMDWIEYNQWDNNGEILLQHPLKP